MQVHQHGNQIENYEWLDHVLHRFAQVRETLHQKAVAEKQRQLKRIEGLIAAKQHENASVALQLSGRLARTVMLIRWS